ncbi:MAG: hypothetical protein MJZ03_01445 [archaeon]|nr:hypothetical protein [archaeon]
MQLEILLAHRYKSSTMCVVSYTMVAMVLGLVPCLIFSIINQESIDPFLIPIILYLVIAGLLATLFKLPEIVRPIDGLIMIAAMWIVAIFAGSVPFIISGMNIVDAIFESTSGITTTGSTIMTDISEQPSGILLWRSVTQWIGGIAIILIFMLIMPMVGFNGRELVGNETSGSGTSNFSIKLGDAAKQFILIYLSLTAVLVILLLILGMSFYEGLCLSLSTISTGGFMCKGDSVISYGVAIKIVVMAFMFLGGTNFYLHFKTIYKHRATDCIQNEEFRTMFLINMIGIVATILIACNSMLLETEHKLTEYVDVAFNVVSASTTTGFVASNYDNWVPGAIILLFVVMIIGGSTGSTSGGLKVGRLIVSLKYIHNSFKEMLHPKAIYDIRLNKTNVEPSTVSVSITIIILFFLTIITGTSVLMLLGIDFQQAIAMIVANLTTFGPSIDPFGAIGNYHDLEWFTKIFLSVVMWLGRLEILTGLILFTPGFWREYMRSRRAGS